MQPRTPHFPWCKLYLRVEDVRRKEGSQRLCLRVEHVGRKEVTESVYTFMYPEKYTLAENIVESDFHSSTSGEEELDDSEHEDECQQKFY